MVVPEVALQGAPQMMFVEYDDMIQTLTSN
jgi:hypothetical protein